MQKLLLNTELANKLLNYLGNKPFFEVNELFKGLEASIVEVPDEVKPRDQEIPPPTKE